MKNSQRVFLGVRIFSENLTRLSEIQTSSIVTFCIHTGASSTVVMNLSIGDDAIQMAILEAASEVVEFCLLEVDRYEF